MDDLLTVFLAETVECLGECDAAVEALRRAPGDAASFDKLLRLLRSVRETSGFLGLPSLHEAAQRSVARLEQAGAAADSDRAALAADCLSALRAVVAALAQPAPADAPSSPSPNPQRVPLAPQSEDGGRGEGEGDGSGILRSSQRETLPSPRPSPAPPERGTQDSAAAATDGSIRVSAETVENLLSTVTRLMAAQAEMMQMLRAGEPARAAASEPGRDESGKVVALAPRRAVPGPAKSSPAGDPGTSPARE